MSPRFSSHLVCLATLQTLAGCQTIDEHAQPGLNGDNLGGAADGGGGSGPAAGGADSGAVEAAATAPLEAGEVPDAGAATLVTTGNEHSCALSKAGAVLCWGAGDRGQLGNGSSAGSALPVPVVSLDAGVTTLAAGTDHTCALVATDGGSAAMCWGRNDHGQLGDGTTTDRLAPVAVQTTASFSAIAAGGYHTCAIADGGTVWCWGQGDSGQLGAGGSSDSATPVAVPGVTGVVALAAGGAHTCAIDGRGAVSCWGAGGNGQLGAGTTSSSSLAIPVTGLGAAALAIAAGNAHTCAMTATGVDCWGYGQYGQLGNGATADSAVPVPVDMLGAGLKGISAGGEHSCALDEGGGGWCWGDDQSGQLGDDGSTDRNSPSPVQGVTAGATCISGGEAHTCAIVAGGGVECWGWNVSGQLGNGTQSDSATAARVPGF